MPRGRRSPISSASPTKWCLATEPERYAERLASSMEEMQAFYDACFPRVEAAIAHCDKFPLDEMPDDAVRLLQLVYSFIMVSLPVEVWVRPESPTPGGVPRTRRGAVPEPTGTED